jgi:hypothetical protein
MLGPAIIEAVSWAPHRVPDSSPSVNAARQAM